ncbi:MAG: hypothetical protein PHD88_04595 [Firmicutes bacterium]|nr:hypothetical protein [Bacillota bacterium]MDD4263223.1 hypothetical protein [Bacillota bacterium]MDD4693671.1 hypothetical protein [Bacillota bacterium]
METITIGLINESSLHKALKEYYKALDQGFVCEVNVDGYVVDLKNNERIIEIQTANFPGIKTKLKNLLEKNQVVLVYPLAKDKWITKLTPEGVILSRRLSPKHCKFQDAFSEFVYIAEILPHPNLTVELLLIQEEEIRVDDGKGSWRRKGVSIKEHHLLNVLDKLTLNSEEDYLAFLPESLEDTFTNRDLAKIGRLNLALARKISYTLRKMGLIKVKKQKGNKNYYKRVNGVEKNED